MGPLWARSRSRALALVIASLIMPGAIGAPAEAHTAMGTRVTPGALADFGLARASSANGGSGADGDLAFGATTFDYPTCQGGPGSGGAAVVDGNDATAYSFTATGCNGNTHFSAWFPGGPSVVRSVRLVFTYTAPTRLWVTCNDEDSRGFQNYEVPPRNGSGYSAWAGGFVDTGRVTVGAGDQPGFACSGVSVLWGSSAGQTVHIFTLSAWAEASPPPAPPGDFGTAHADTFGLQPAQAYSKDPVNLATGSFTAHMDDLALPGRVIPFAFTRWYNSADPTTGPLGPGWTHSYNWSLADKGSSVEIRRGDGRRDVFARNADGSYADPPAVFDTFDKNADGTFTLTLASQAAYAFASDGRLTRISEPAGKHVDLAYASGQLASITDTVGRVVTLAYDAAGELASIADPLGRKVTYAYDGSKRLVTVTDRIGNGAGPASAHQWHYAYDGASSHVVSVTDPDGRVRVTNTYDAQGRVTQQRDGLGALTTMTYGSAKTTLTDPRGHATTYSFDDHLRVLTQADVVGASTLTLAYTYDAAGDRTSVTDRTGARTDFTYDGRGNVLSKTDPAPSPAALRPVTRFAYDARNDLTAVTDPLGFTTTLTYDPRTNVLLQVSRPIDAATSAVTRYAYTDAANPGLPTAVTSPRGSLTTLAYNARGDLVRRTDPDGATTTFQHDAAGRPVAFVDPDGNAPGAVPSQHTWAIRYDEDDRETARTDPLGNTISYDYDGSGDRVALTDRNGNISAYDHDANARLIGVRQQPDPLGPTTYLTQAARDASGNATRIIQANSVVTDYAFDALDRLTSVTTHPSASLALTTSYALDGDGRPVSRTTGDGVTVTYAYDALGRLTSVSGPALRIGYQYDAAGHRTSMTDATGTTRYSYDGLGRVTEVVSPERRLGYEYDPDGNRTALSYPGGDAVRYTYSPGGRLTSVTDWSGRTSRYRYTPAGLVSRLSYPNGLVAAYGYDSAQRLTSLAYARSEEALEHPFFAQRFTLDGEGDRTALDETLRAKLAGLGGDARQDTATASSDGDDTDDQRDGAPGVTDHFAMSYDGLERLTALTAPARGDRPSPLSETFSYDAATNLAGRTGPAATYTLDGANRVTADGSRAFVWDGADRLIQRGPDTFAYDPLGRLTSSEVRLSAPPDAADAPRTRSETYAYDGDGLLRSRTVRGEDEGRGHRHDDEDDSQTTAFLWDTSLAPAPLLAAGTDRIIQGLGPLYLVRADDHTTTLVRDALGSVRAETNSKGAITKAFRYKAYGAVAQRSPASASPTLLGFAGELADPSGLLYLRARWYDPTTGRFMSRDPFAGMLRRPVTLNSYAYAWGRPQLVRDPSGLEPRAGDPATPNPNAPEVATVVVGGVTAVGLVLGGIVLVGVGIGIAAAGIAEGAATGGTGIVVTTVALYEGTEVAATGAAAFAAGVLLASQTVGKALQYGVR